MGRALAVCSALLLLQGASRAQPQSAQTALPATEMCGVGCTRVTTDCVLIIYNGTPVRLCWRISHLGTGSPEFSVAVEVFLADQPMRSSAPIWSRALAGQSVGVGELEWPGLVDLREQGASTSGDMENAQAGLYKYRVVAQHNTTPSTCRDSSVSDNLTATARGLIHDGTSTMGVTSCQVPYVLDGPGVNVRAGIYGARQDGSFGILAESAEFPGPTEGRQHSWPFDAGLPIGDAERPTVPIVAVVTAYEATCGITNERTQVGKPADPVCSRRTYLLVVDLSFDGIKEEDEESPGLLVPVSRPGRELAPRPVHISAYVDNGFGPGTVTLTWTNNGTHRIWEDAAKTLEIPPEPAPTWTVEAGASTSSRTFYIEGVRASSRLGENEFVAEVVAEFQDWE